MPDTERQEWPSIKVRTTGNAWNRGWITSRPPWPLPKGEETYVPASRLTEVEAERQATEAELDALKVDHRRRVEESDRILSLLESDGVVEAVARAKAEELYADGYESLTETIKDGIRAIVRSDLKATKQAIQKELEEQND